MVWLALHSARPARAGCAVDEDGPERRREAPLALSGTVERVDVIEGQSPEAFYVRQHVRVERTYKGSVDSGWITLLSHASGHYCPPDRIYAVGQRVYAVGSPTDGATLTVSACTEDTGILTGDDERWLSALPRRPGRHLSGARPPEASAREELSGLPSPGPLSLRVVAETSAGQTPQSASPRVPTSPLEGEILESDGAMHRALFSLENIDLALWVGEEGLARVPTREVRISGDDTASVVLKPGAPIEILSEGEGRAEVRIDDSGLSATGTVQSAALGTVWARTEPMEPFESYVARPSPLWHHPSGPVLGEIAPGRGLTVRARGGAVGDLLPVEIRGSFVEATGYIRDTSAAEGVLGGIVGGISSARHVALSAGVVLSTTEGPPEVFGIVTGETWVRLLHRGEGEAWVLLETPLGLFPARALCGPGPEDKCMPR